MFFHQGLWYGQWSQENRHHTFVAIGCGSLRCGRSQCILKHSNPKAAADSVASAVAFHLLRAVEKRISQNMIRASHAHYWGRLRAKTAECRGCGGQVSEFSGRPRLFVKGYLELAFFFSLAPILNDTPYSKLGSDTLDLPHLKLKRFWTKG